MDLHTYLTEHTLMFDGAMGTYYAALGGTGSVELACLTAPEKILEIHRAYLNAGAEALKTNTFCANRFTLGEASCGSVLDAAYVLAEKAAGDKPVFADLGPLPSDVEDPAAEYRFLCQRFLRLGARNFLFETLPDTAGIPEAVEFIKSEAPEAFVLVSFAIAPDGFTQKGRLGRDLLRAMDENPNVDALGLNCVTGAGHMAALVDTLGAFHKPMSVMPNAGYPTVLGRQTYYHGKPGYFGSQLRELAARGVKILGGCCGTTPEHIAAAAEALKQPLPPRIAVAAAQPAEKVEKQESAFWAALSDSNKKPIAVELDPPEAADVTKFMAGAKELRDSGADIITIADCPIARARMDANILACKLHRELGVEALPHMTCRDRNLNATKALLLGLSAEDIRNVLVITGDPIPSASRDEVKSVYNFNSRMLAHFISALNDTVLPAPFHIFGALNVNAPNFHVQLDLAQKKVENGIRGFLTQPVLTAEGLRNLRAAREALGPEVKLLGGIIPIVSHRNAKFMNSEVSGITVDDKTIARYEGLDRAQGEDLATELSVQFARDMAEYVDGFYLITPFGRTALMARIIAEMRKAGLVTD